MDKKLILGIGILVLAGFGYLYVTNQEKNKKTKSEADAKAQADLKAIADANEKKRQEDLARMNDPERKKLYDEIYLGIIKFITDKINANYDRMKEMGKGGEGEEERMKNNKNGELIGVKGNALKWWDERLGTFNKMSIDEIKLYLMFIRDANSIQNDAFLFRDAQNLLNKYPDLGLD